MLRSLIITAIGVGLSAAATSTTTRAENGRATPAAAPAANVSLVQPDKIPGNWKLTPQPWPAIDSILKRPAPARPVYGLYTWTGEYRGNRESIRKVGWKSFRVAGPLSDDDMKMFVQDDVEVLKCLDAWDLGGGRRQVARQDFASDDAFLAAYVKVIDAFLTRYGPGGTFFKDQPTLPVRPIQFVEIWNEPNFQYMIPDRAGDRQKLEAERELLYAKVLPAAYKAIKEKWPAVTVLGFGAGGGNLGDVRFIQHVIELDPARLAKSFDILSTHPYQPPTPPEVDSLQSWGSYSMTRSLEAIRKILAAHRAGDVPIWYTEVGWPIAKADGGDYDMDPKLTTTPLLQAAYVVRLYALAARLGVDRVHIMFTTDADGFNAGFFSRASHSWRLSTRAVQTMIRWLPNPRIRKIISDGADGYYAYEYRANVAAQGIPEVPVIMAWNVAGPKTVELAVQARAAKVVDMLGGETSVEARDGQVHLEVGPCPVYVRPVGP